MLRYPSPAEASGVDPGLRRDDGWWVMEGEGANWEEVARVDLALTGLYRLVDRALVRIYVSVRRPLVIPSKDGTHACVGCS